MVRCYVTDRRAGDIVRFAKRAVSEGVDYIQIREKDLAARELFTLVCRIREIASGHACVREAASPLSMYIGPHEVLLTLDVKFEPRSTAENIAHAVAEIERDIRARFPRVTRIYIEARAIAAAGE